MTRAILRTVLALACAAVAGCAARASDPAPAATDGDPFVRSFRALRPAVVLFTMNIPSDDKKRKGEFDEAYAGF